MDDERSSKELLTIDEDGKRFVIESLEGDSTRGFDIDSLYCVVNSDGTVKWVIIELLKCISVSPAKSHPSRYLDKNGRKFLSIWTLCLALRKAGCKAEVLLVNYSLESDEVKTMWVESLTETNIVTRGDTVMNREEWRAKFKKFNSSKLGETWQAMPYLSSFDSEI